MPSGSPMFFNYEPKNSDRFAGEYETVLMAHVVEAADATPQQWKMQFASEGGATCYISNASLLALKLDAADAYLITNGIFTASATFVDASVSSLSFTPATEGDYLILAVVRFNVFSGAAPGELQLVHGANTYTVQGRTLKDSANYVCYATALKLTLGASPQNFKIQVRSPGSTIVDPRNMLILALRLDKFANVYYNESRTRDSLANTFSPTVKAAVTQTPAASREHFVLATGLLDCNSATSSVFAMLDEDGTDLSSHLFEGINSTVDANEHTVQFARRITPTVASHTWALEYTPEGAGVIAGISDAAVIVIDLEEAAGGGADNLIPADIAQAHSADSVVLTQAHILATQDAAQAHSVDSVVLSVGAVDLVLADSAQAHGIDNAVLTQEHQLSAQDAAQAHSADNLALTQAHQLSAQDAAQAHSADNLALTQAHVLSAQDATHAHAMDSLALTQAHVLALADAILSHTAENVELSGEASLAMSDLLHAQAAGNATLTQAHILLLAELLHAHAVEAVTIAVADVTVIPNDVAHAQALDTPALTQAHLLAVAEMFSAHSVDEIPLTSELTLALAGLLHSQAAEALNLSQAHVLAVADFGHALSMDSASLTQMHVLTVSDATMAHALAALNLTLGAFTPAGERLLVLRAENRVLVLRAENRVLALQRENRTLTLH